MSRHSHCRRRLTILAVAVLAAIAWVAPTPGDAQGRETGITGRVVAEDGSPVVGATVRALVLFDGFSLDRQFVLAEGVEAATTDESGRFRLVGLLGHRRVWVRAIPKQALLATRSQPQPIARRGVRDIGTIVVHAPRTLTGRVVGEDGEPVGDAAVFLGKPRAFEPLADNGDGGMVMRRGVVRFAVDDDEGLNDNEEGFGESPEGSHAIWPRRRHKDDAVRTTANGEFTLDRMADGTHQLAVRKAGCLDIAVEHVAVTADGPQPLTLTMERSPELLLVIVDHNGDPVADATVLTRNYDYDLHDERYFSSDEGGTVPVLDLYSRKVQIDVYAEGFVEHRQSVELAGDEPDLVIEMERGVRVTGRLLNDKTGEPVTFAHVMARSDPREDREIEHEHARTDGSGNFAFEMMRAGRWTLHLHAEGFQPHSKAVTVEPGEDGSMDLGELRIEPLPPEDQGGSINVTVVDKDGKPQANLEVTVGVHSYAQIEGADGITRCYFLPPGGGRMFAQRRGRQLPMAAGVTDAEGKVLLEGLRPGTYDMDVLDGETFVAVKTDVVAPEGDQDPTAVRVVLDKGGVVTGTARRANGKPWDVMTVHLRCIGREMQLMSMPTGLDGKYRFPDVPPGTYMVSLQETDDPWSDDICVTDRFEVTPGATIEKDLQQPPQFRVVGTVRATDGSPVAGATVCTAVADLDAGRWMAEPKGHVVTDANGKYELEDLYVESFGGIPVIGVNHDGTTHWYRVHLTGDPHDVVVNPSIPAEPTKDNCARVTLTCVNNESDAARAGCQFSLSTMAVPMRGGADPDPDAPERVVRIHETTDADGKWSGWLPPGHYTLSVQVEGFAPEGQVMLVAAGEERAIDVRLYRTADLVVRMKLPEGVPGSFWAVVQVTPVGESGEPGRMRRSSIDFNDGVGVITRLRTKAKYRIRIESSQLAPLEFEHMVDADHPEVMVEGKPGPSARFTAAYNLLDAKQWEQAEAAFRSIVDDFPELGEPHYHLSCFHTRRSLDLEGDAKKAQLDEAVACFAKAVEHGFANTTHIDSDPDMDPIRERDDYKAARAKLDE